jgi:spiro-SPASM protein
MNALAVLYGASLKQNAFNEDVMPGKNSFFLALQHTAAFKDITKIVLFVQNDFDESLLPVNIEGIELVRQDSWNTKSFLTTLAKVTEGFDLTYFAWADCPLLDPCLAEALETRHINNAAEYSYSDGYPDGISPELLSPGTAAFLLKLNGDDENPVERGTLFSVLQKDINSFDIETELSDIDFRSHRINLAADSKRNLLLIKRFIDAGWTGHKSCEKIILERPELLRSLPNFFPIMVSAKCPQVCSICPYGKESKNEFMPLDKFNLILDKIIEWTGEAVIDLSLWGEIALHPQKIEIINSVLKHNELSLIIETCGLDWSKDDINKIAQISNTPRTNGMNPLSWIVSLDAYDKSLYTELHGEGFENALEFTKNVLEVFTKNVYVQAIRTKGNEDDIEKFYRFWQEQNANIIIQKYDWFCDTLADKRAGDISPLVREPCFHIMRDMPIQIDGAVPSCKETIVLKDNNSILGNVFKDSLDAIWKNGEELYKDHCVKNYSSFCKKCDEYYTYNF